MKNWPEGDMLIIAGDLTWLGTLQEIAKELTQINKLPYKYKIVVAGNHDMLFQRDPTLARLLCKEHGIIYLEDQLVELDGFSFYGTPWCPRFGNWSFMRERGEALAERWALTPSGVDVLITHTPPRGIGDLTQEGDHAGDMDLLLEITQRIKPKLHVFGHIHEGYGNYPPGNSELKIQFVNASLTDRQYRPINPPITYNLGDSIG